MSYRLVDRVIKSDLPTPPLKLTLIALASGEATL